MNFVSTAVACFLSVAAGSALANEVSVFAGLSQPLLFNGRNLEVAYATESWVFDYSHGWNLHISDYEPAMAKDEVDQKLRVFTPWSTGGGVGYRITPAFHAALEYKVHRFEIDHPTFGEFDYITRTLGVGIYYQWRPFDGSGFTVMPALRYWPTIATSLDDDEQVFADGTKHKAHGFDVAPNIKLGWTF